MSDTPQGGWWRASDGKWYPPEVHPDRHVPDESQLPADEPPPAAAPTRPEPDPDRGTFDLGPRTAPIAEPPAPRRPLFGGGDAGAAPSTPGQAPAAASGGVAGPTGGTPSAAGRPPVTPGTPSTAGAESPASGPSDGTPDPTIAPWPSVPGAEGAATAPDGAVEPDSDAAEQPGAGRKRLLILGGVLAAVVILGGAVLFLTRGEDEAAAPTSTSAPASSTTTTSTTSAPSSTAPAAPAEAAPIPAQASGVGTATVQVGRPVTEPYLALITHDGPGPMAFELLDADGGVVQDLVAGVGSGQYLGVVPVNFSGGEFTAVRFTGEGPWAVTFALPDSAPDLAVAPGSSITRAGDWVVSFAPEGAAPLSVDCGQCASPVEVRAWSASASSTPDPLVADGGQVSVPAGTQYLQVTARSAPGTPAPEWSIAVA